MDIETHLKEVIKRMLVVRETCQLASFVSKAYLTEQVTRISLLLPFMYRKYGVILDFDEETLEILQTGDIQYFTQSIQDYRTQPFFVSRKQRCQEEEPVHLIYTIKLVDSDEGDGKCSYSCSLVSNQCQFASTTSREYALMSKLKRHAADHKESLDLLRKRMDTFIVTTELSSYTPKKDKPSMEERKEEILAWLSHTFAEKNIFVQLDIDERDDATFLKQLFTGSQAYGSSFLDTLLNHAVYRQKWQHTTGPTIEKRLLTFSCLSYKVKDSYLVDQSRFNPSIFSDLQGYKEYASKEETHPLIDVCYTQYLEKVISLHVVPKPLFATIQRAIKVAKMPIIALSEDRDGVKMSSCLSSSQNGEELATQVENNIKQYAIEKSSAILVKHDENHRVQIVVDKELTQLLAKRVAYFLSVPVNGLETSLTTIRACIDHALDKASLVIEEKEWASFHDEGNLTLSKMVMPLASFQLKEGSELSAFVLGITKVKANKAILAHHVDKKMDNVSLLIIKFGTLVLSANVIPCIVNEYYGSEKRRDTPLLMHNHSRIEDKEMLASLTSKNRSYLKLLERMAEEDDRETRKEILNTLSIKKRKRQPPSHIEAIKKIKTPRDPVAKEDELSIICESESLKEAPVNLHTRNKNCLVCNVLCNLSHFYYKIDKTKQGGKVYHYIRNICHSCKAKKGAL